MRDKNCETGPQPGMYANQGQPTGMEAQCERPPDMKRKEELFQLAKSIAVQVGELTHRRERCLLRSMVEMLLEG